MNIKLTDYSTAAGCGCKLAPGVLSEILDGSKQEGLFTNLIIGNEAKDDAAVLELDGGKCIISTTDFFTPIVDDPYDFGRIAACNAISDVYAMGGKPLMAIAILVWPIQKLPAEAAQQLMKGAQDICTLAGIPLAGGHSIENQEPIFGLAVTGEAEKKHIKHNNTAQGGDILYLTKPLGTGILATAIKRGIATDTAYTQLVDSATTLNKIGMKLGELEYVNALTDVTGFGLVGHLLEMLDGQNLTAHIFKNHVPVFEEAETLSKQFVYPNGTTNNYKTQAAHFDGLVDAEFIIYCDPQTSGGLLFSVDPSFEKEMDAILNTENQFFAKVGKIETQTGNHKIIFS